MIARFFLATALLTTSLHPALAAEIRIRTLALKAGAFPKTFVKGKDGYLPLTFSDIQPSAPIKATAVNPFPIYELKAGKDGEESYAVAAQVQLPSGAKGALVVGINSGKKLNYIALNDDIASATSSDWLLLNATNKPIAFTVGDDARPIQIAPGKSTTYRITAAKGKGAAVVAKAPYGQKVKTIYSTYWPVYPDKRSLVLFIADGEKIRVKRISDKVGATKKPTTP